jgi:prevent-host-death family protein
MMVKSLYNNCTKEAKTMTIIMPIAQARSKLTSLPRQLHDRDTVTITSRGKPVLAVIPWELFESITETLEIMGDSDLMKLVRQGVKELKQGKGISWNTAKKQIGL